MSDARRMTGLVALPLAIAALLFAVGHPAFAQGVDADEDVNVECEEGAEAVWDEDSESWYCVSSSDEETTSDTEAGSEPDVSCMDDHYAEWDEVTESWYCAWRGDTPEIDCADAEVAVYEDGTWSCKEPTPPDMNARISCDEGSVPRWDGVGESWGCEDAEPCEVCEEWQQACAFEIAYQARLCTAQMAGIARSRCSPKRGGEEPGRNHRGQPVEAGVGVTCQQDQDSGFHKCEGPAIEECVDGYATDNPDVADSHGSEHGFNYNVGATGKASPLGVGLDVEVSGGGSHAWNSSQTVSWGGRTGYRTACRTAAEAAEKDVCRAYVRLCLERHQCVDLD